MTFFVFFWACLMWLLLGKRRYNIKLWKTFTDCFNCLPIAAIVDEKIFCCHGGLSPDLQSMEQIRRIMRPTDVPDTGQSLLKIVKIATPNIRANISIICFTIKHWTEASFVVSKKLRLILNLLFNSGLLCDLLWSDPDKDVQGWGENDRGVSYRFAMKIYYPL